MSDPATPSIGTQAEAILTALGVTLGADAVTALKTTLGNTAANIQANPTVTNATVQGAALLPAFIAVAPSLETEAIQQAAGALGQLINLIPTPAA